MDPWFIEQLWELHQVGTQMIQVLWACILCNGLGCLVHSLLPLVSCTCCDLGACTY